jgi:hypothetical protein
VRLLDFNPEEVFSIRVCAWNVVSAPAWNMSHRFFHYQAYMFPFFRLPCFHFSAFNDSISQPSMFPFPSLPCFHFPAFHVSISQPSMFPFPNLPCFHISAFYVFHFFASIFLFLRLTCFYLQTVISRIAASASLKELTAQVTRRVRIAISQLAANKPVIEYQTLMTLCFESVQAQIIKVSFLDQALKLC